MKSVIFKLQSGVTLIELTLFMGLMSIFLVITTQIFLSALSIQSESQSISGVEQDGRYILARLQHDVGKASTITTPAAVGDGSTSFVFVANGYTNTYALSGGNLQITDNTGTYTLNSYATSVGDLQFTRRGNANGKATISTSFRLTSVIRDEQGLQTKLFQATYGLR